MKNKTIAVAGYGYVGKAVVDFFKRKYKIRIFDPACIGNEGYEDFKYVGSLEDLSGADLLVVCVPTPMKADRTCDTSIVEEVIDKVNVNNVLIKSTVTPGTTDMLGILYKGVNIAFSPEYIGEGGYHDPFGFANSMFNTPFWVVGGTDLAVNAVLDLVVPIGGPAKTYYKCTAKEAEVIKYMENLYFGIKITFAQQMYDACQALGVDWYRVREGWALDPRVDKMHTAVFPNNRGFGGKCLPKDLNAFVQSCRKVGFEFSLLQTAIEINEKNYNPDAKPNISKEEKQKG